MQDLEAVDAALAELYRECGLEKVWSVLLELNARNNDVYAKLREFTLEVSKVPNDFEKVKRKLESKGLHLSAKRGSEEQLIREKGNSFQQETMESAKTQVETSEERDPSLLCKQPDLHFFYNLGKEGKFTFDSKLLEGETEQRRSSINRATIEGILASSNDILSEYFVSNFYSSLALTKESVYWNGKIEEAIRISSALSTLLCHKPFASTLKASVIGRLAESMFCFKNLSLQILKETCCTLLQNESEKHSLNLLADFTCILLNRFRNPTEAQAFLLETLRWSRNNSLNISAFFKLANWYYLHRERDKIKQLLQEYTAIKQELGMKEKDSIIEYIECFTEPLQDKRPSIAYFYFLTSTGQPERAYCILRSISDSLSKPQYLNMLFDCEK